VIRVEKEAAVKKMAEAFGKTPHLVLATFKGLKVNQVKLGNALSLILDAVGGSLQWRVEDGVVKIYSGEDEVEELILRFYDVTEIVNSPPDFPAPTLGLNLGEIGGAGGGGGGGNILNLDEGDEESSGGFTSDTLVDLVNTRLGESEDEGSVEYSGGILIVRKPLEAHKRIIKLLEALRETVGVMVTVEAMLTAVVSSPPLAVPPVSLISVSVTVRLAPSGSWLVFS